MTSWEDLRKPHRTPPTRPTESALNDLEDACAEALTTPAGRRLLEVLEEAYLFAVPSATSSDSALREHNAKRQLVRDLRLKMESGLAARRKATEKAK